MAKVGKNKNLPIIFQISNDEKREENNRYLKLLEVQENTKEILRKLGYIDFDLKNLKVFTNLDPVNYLVLRNISDYILTKIKLKTVSSIFGNISLQNASYMGVQMAPVFIFNNLYDGRAIVITASDQKGCFFLLRDVCKKLNQLAPIVVFLKPLKDVLLKQKMSASNFKKSIDLDTLDFSKAISGLNTNNDFCKNLIDFFDLKIEIPSSTKTLKENLKKLFLEERKNFKIEEFNFNELYKDYTLYNLMSKIEEKSI